MWYVYILKGKRYYVGITDNIQRRLAQHKSGHTHSTKRLGGEIVLLGYFMYDDKPQAIQQERAIKKSGHIARYLGVSGFVTYEGL